MSLAESLSEAGHQVLLLSGGFPIERVVRGYHYFQLPPTRAIDDSFVQLVDEQGKAIDDAWRKRRGAILMAEIRRFKPAMIITESFPFGRRQFRFELEPLLDWVSAQKNVRLIASIRDVLQRRAPRRDRQTVQTVEAHYDGVLVHADDALFKLDASFALSHEIKDKLVYTGYIHQPPLSNSGINEREGRGEVIVSGGGGAVSAHLIELARRAKPLSSARSRSWRLLTGRGGPNKIVHSRENIIIEPNRPDFFALLGRCDLSVSQAGYNTSLDVLASGVRSVMIPFAGSNETEQSDRAQALERAGRLIQLAEAGLTPKALAAAIDRALEMRPSEVKVDLNGAANSAQWISAMLCK